jgi:hypothetical protein
MDSRILHLVSTIDSMISFQHVEHVSYREFIDSLCSEYKHMSADTMIRDLSTLYDHALPIVAQRIKRENYERRIKFDELRMKGKGQEWVYRESSAFY